MECIVPRLKLLTPLLTTIENNRKEKGVKRKDFEQKSKENGFMEEEEIITGAMEVISFDNTLGKMERVIESNFLQKKILRINFVTLYTTIDEYE